MTESQTSKKVCSGEFNNICRTNEQTLLERAQCMLFSEVLQRKFWVEAVNTTCYLVNNLRRLPLNVKHLKKYGPILLLIILV